MSEPLTHYGTHEFPGGVIVTTMRDDTGKISIEIKGENKEAVQAADADIQQLINNLGHTAVNRTEEVRDA